MKLVHPDKLMKHIDIKFFAVSVCVCVYISSMCVCLYTVTLCVVISEQYKQLSPREHKLILLPSNIRL